MKSILLSVRPEWVAKILNKEKTIEIRKKFPKDYRGWVYIYCTINGGLLHCMPTKNGRDFFVNNNECDYCYNGKVVARFWCDKIEEINPKIWNPSLERSILSSSCLTEHQLFGYIERNNDEVANRPFYAIHISKLEIFDKPKELNSFYILEYILVDYEEKSIKKAPQNYMYIEEKNIKYFKK